MRVIFTCGGTAGHVNPAIALAQLMGEKDPASEFLFVGAERGLEKDLIPKAGYDFKTVHISSFHRSYKPAEIKHNLVSVCNLLRAPREARAILREFRPDVVIGTGGYASYPTVKEAAKAGIPTLVHESNMVPGLTTEMLEPYAGRIMVGFESCREHYRRWRSPARRCGRISSISQRSRPRRSWAWPTDGPCWSPFGALSAPPA